MSILKETLRLGNTLFAKKNIILFYSQLGLYDNPYYIYQKMKEMNICEFWKCIWIIDNKEEFNYAIDKNIPSIWSQQKKDVLKLILQAKFYITSTTLGPWWKSKKQITIFVDHGLPLFKGVGYYYPEWYPNSKYTNYFDYAIAPSHFMRVLYSGVYHIHPSNILITGTPRQDIIYESSTDNAMKLLEDLLGEDISGYDKRILYVPTFREYNNYFIKTKFTKLLKEERLRKTLEKYNSVLIFKPHVVEENYFKDLIKSLDLRNIKILSNDPMLKRKVTIYEFLKAIDIIISDYSSAWIEFLLLNRPILYFIPDIDIYRKKRGSILEPYEKWTPGDKAKSINDLINFIEDAVNDPNKWKKEREWMRDIIFEYKDNKCRERLIKHFWM